MFFSPSTPFPQSLPSPASHWWSTRVGLKMSWLNAAWQGHIPTSISLGVIVGILALSIGLSLVFRPSYAPKDPLIKRSDR